MPSKIKTTTPGTVSPPRRQVAPGAERLMYRFDEVAAMLGCTPRQLKRWIADGRIKPTKPAGLRGPTFFTRAEIERCLREWST